MALELLPRRPLALWAAAAARSVLQPLGLDPAMAAVAAAEAWAVDPTRANRELAGAAAYAVLDYLDSAGPVANDGGAHDAVSAAGAAAESAAYETRLAAAVAAAAAAGSAAHAAARERPSAVARERPFAASWGWLYRTYVRCLGPDGVAFDPAWRTRDAVAIARAAAASRDCSTFPILADVLEDAGCDLHLDLDTLREDSEHHTPADWVVWNLLGLDVPV